MSLQRPFWDVSSFLTLHAWCVLKINLFFFTYFVCLLMQPNHLVRLRKRSWFSSKSIEPQSPEEQRTRPPSSRKTGGPYWPYNAEQFDIFLLKYLCYPSTIPIPSHKALQSTIIGAQIGSRMHQTGIRSGYQVHYYLTKLYKDDNTIR